MKDNSAPQEIQNLNSSDRLVMASDVINFINTAGKQKNKSVHERDIAIILTMAIAANSNSQILIQDSLIKSN
ncbi:hypothetical protein OP862_02145 [Yersinia massiliensis]|uniref:Uncharacterized protein n=1 Tax=Yersinia aldovae TaxID=29483 RepID=A0ABM9SY01_YERAL|nr:MULTISPECIES: hypothetical protein [Yersinia]MBX9474167.1 hypothetical protein [Yersinia enterocolitica]MDA5548572.1 hypothetical protein [Yersinia massiliensis]UYK06126.1 hypothetical protein N4218_21835 [Yersinia enterocolitica]UZM79511.1 hypothetical protein OP862_02145 [Yersinia massiliensis]CNL62148.1 Uncharacterised protein [Yersinia aldovae]